MKISTNIIHLKIVRALELAAQREILPSRRPIGAPTSRMTSPLHLLRKGNPKGKCDRKWKRDGERERERGKEMERERERELDVRSKWRSMSKWCLLEFLPSELWDFVDGKESSDPDWEGHPSWKISFNHTYPKYETVTPVWSDFESNNLVFSIIWFRESHMDCHMIMDNDVTVWILLNFHESHFSKCFFFNLNFLLLSYHSSQRKSDFVESFNLTQIGENWPFEENRQIVENPGWRFHNEVWQICEKNMREREWESLGERTRGKERVCVRENAPHDSITIFDGLYEMGRGREMCCASQPTVNIFVHKYLPRKNERKAKEWVSERKTTHMCKMLIEFSLPPFLFSLLSPLLFPLSLFALFLLIRLHHMAYSPRDHQRAIPQN